MNLHGGSAAIAQSGGPTSVINASLAGAVEACRNWPGLRSLYGVRFGAAGLVQGDFLDLLPQDPALLESIGQSPGAALGSSRRSIEPDELAVVLQHFRTREIRCLFYAGGNGSMETALRLEQFARDQHYELQVIGIPKTIDNDLMETDHSPGYGSAARFFAHAARDVGEDNRSLPSPICILEVLGRNTGWIAAATALARHRDDDAPHLIYFPEHPVSADQLLADVEQVYQRFGRVVIAVCEGQLDDRGQPFGADLDRAGDARHRLASNLGHSLARLISERLGIRARSEKPGLMGRSSGVLVSSVDRQEAYECGIAAVTAARRGESGVMIGLRRESGDLYRCSTFQVPFSMVAGKEKRLPAKWISPRGNDILQAFSDYAGPLIGAPSAYPRLLEQ